MTGPEWFIELELPRQLESEPVPCEAYEGDEDCPDALPTPEDTDTVDFDSSRSGPGIRYGWWEAHVTFTCPVCSGETTRRYGDESP